MGGVRTALFNYLFARQNHGVMILRIEDTDQNRYVPGAEEYIMESLAWCGISIDEGVREGGSFGPYRQSERQDIYREYVDLLLRKGKAYYAFDTPESLEKKREEAATEGKDSFQYDSMSRMQMINSLTLDEMEVQDRLGSGEPYVIRFRIPENTEVSCTDLIRGTVRVDSGTLDDKVLFKSDGMPTYHLANVVDDHLMEISHVIRGEEWLPSLPLHVLLYEAFDWKPPVFAHLPLLLKPTGKGKLSKRDGDKMGFPVFPLAWEGPDGETASGYRESGYYPEAFVNMLALLGWNPGDDREIFSMDELIEAFSLERVGKSGARFDPEKARWFNHHYLMNRSPESLAAEFMPILEEKGVRIPLGELSRIVLLVKNRVHFVHELWEETSFFFRPPEQYDEQAVKKRWKNNTADALTALAGYLDRVEPFTAENLEVQVIRYLEEEELNPGQVMNGLRLALVGKLAGPGMFDICAILGRGEVRERIEKACKTIRV